MIKRISLLAFLLLLTGQLLPQNRMIRITGDFREATFIDFVNYVETGNKDIRFLFDPVSVEDIVFSKNFSDTPLLEALNIILSGSEIYPFIDKSGYIILTSRFRIKGATYGILKDSAFIFNPLDITPPVIAVQDDFQIIEIGSKTGGYQGRVTLSGYIRTVETGEPVIGALLWVDEIKAASMTNQYGYYSITLPQGNYHLQVSCLGMKSLNRQVNIYSSGKLDIDMSENPISLGSVTVTAEDKNSIRRAQVGLEKLDIKTVRLLPSSMGESDIIKTALLLPGVQTIGEGSAGFNVRGGSADQNLILLYDVPLLNPSHFFGFFSSINPDVISDIALYKGGIPAKFGGRISSVLEILPRDGNKKTISGGGGISPITTSLFVEGPIKKDRTSFLIAGRTTYSNWLLKLFDDVQLGKSRISFYDANLRLVHEVNEKNNLEFSGYLSHDDFKFNNDTVYSYNNLIASVKWRHVFSNRLFGVFSANHSGYDYNISSERDKDFSFNLFHKVNYTEFKAQASFYPNNKHQIDFGLEYGIYRVIPGELTPFGDSSLVISTIIERQNGVVPALYINDEIKIGERLNINAGFRVSSFFATGPSEVIDYLPGFPKSRSSIDDTLFYDAGRVVERYLNPEIRLSINYMAGANSSFRLNWNTINQYIHQISNTTSVSPTDIWILTGRYIKPQKGQQLAAGFYSKFFGSRIEFSLEAYHKTIRNMIDFKGGATLLLNRNIETDIVNTFGNANGVEVMIKKSRGRLNGWISYTYSRVLVESVTLFPEEHINSGARFPANYDKPHDVSAVFNYMFSRRFSVSSTYTYSTGRPITYPIALYNFGGNQVLHYSDRNKYRVPDYSRLDISFTLDGNLKSQKLAHSTFNFSVYNLLGRDNVYSIFFKTEYGIVNGYKLSVFARPIPSVSYSFKF
jgi:hypothetical protein